MKKTLFLAISLLGLSFTPQASAASFSASQKQDIKNIVHDYLITNPEVLLEASQALQDKQQKAILDHAQAAIPKHAKALFSSENSPVLGNHQGDIYLVKFVDYACGHCRNMHPVVQQLIKKHHRLKVVIKEYPIFQGASERAAKFALAAKKHNKYKQFHHHLMQTKPPLDNQKIDAIAVKLGLDVDELKRTADMPWVATELKDNLVLAQHLGIMGTPALIVAAKVNSDNIKALFVPGASSYEVLADLIKQVSSA